MNIKSIMIILPKLKTAVFYKKHEKGLLKLDK